MSKNFYLVITVLLISSFTLSGCIGQKNDSDTPINMNNQNDESFTGNLKSLVGLNKSQKCTWQGNDGESGVVYTDGKKSRFEAHDVMVADFNNQKPEEKGSMYSISDGEYTYTWSTASKEGMKIQIPEEDEFMDEEDMDDTAYMQGDEEYVESIEESQDEYDYKCSNWKVDNKMFTPPSDIVFKDLSIMMDQLKADLGKMQGMCDILEGEERSECVEALME